MSDFEDFLEKQTPAVQEIARAVRAVVVSELPELGEKLDRGHWVVRYGSTRKMSEDAVYISAHKDSVNLGFLKGTSLADPAKLLHGTGKNLLHIKFKAGDATDTPAIRALLQAALAFDQKA